MRAEAQDARSIAPMHIKRFETIGWLREEGVYILERVIVFAWYTHSFQVVAYVGLCFLSKNGRGGREYGEEMG